jgi:CDP-glycerol glycerophosphotransferase
MMFVMVRFSFIVPIFNTDTFYLKQCLETIANQTFTDYDCLLINDCSTNAATISFLTQ